MLKLMCFLMERGRHCCLFLLPQKNKATRDDKVFNGVPLRQEESFAIWDTRHGVLAGIRACVYVCAC